MGGGGGEFVEGVRQGGRTKKRLYPVQKAYKKCLIA
jgi:hypothetical protein